jgi:hypothetical protein
MNVIVIIIMISPIIKPVMDLSGQSQKLSVSQFVLVSGLHPGPATNYSFASLEIILIFAVLSIWCALSDERVGLEFMVADGLHQCSVLVLSSVELMTILDSFQL